jgi:hypothetical protein
VQPPDHGDRQIALAVEDLGDPRVRTDDGFEIAAAQSLLLHPKLDGLGRVGRINRKMRRLVSVDHRGEYLQPASLISGAP